MTDHFPVDLSTEKIKYDNVYWIVQQKEIDLTQYHTDIYTDTDEVPVSWQTLRIFETKHKASEYFNLCKSKINVPLRIVAVELLAWNTVPLDEDQIRYCR